jgi:hypothetical protein
VLVVPLLVLLPLVVMVQKGRPLVVSSTFVQREDRRPRHPRHGRALCALCSTTSPLLQFVWRVVRGGGFKRREAGAKLRIAYRRARSTPLLFLLWRCCCGFGLLWECGVFFRFASAQPPHKVQSNPAGYASTAKAATFERSPPRRRIYVVVIGFCQSAWPTDPVCGR